MKLVGADTCPAALPFTGSNVAAIIALAVCIVLTGSTLLVWRRRSLRVMCAVGLMVASLATLGTFSSSHSAYAAQDCSDASATSTTIAGTALTVAIVATTTATASEAPVPVVPETPLPVLLGALAMGVFGLGALLDRRTPRSSNRA